ncbi:MULTISPECIES: CBO0543 family protein [Priestia]|uniref:CBO0543 family protein n=1 Tax=Priestia TaxID=2800373 RepID=UPI0035A957AF
MRLIGLFLWIFAAWRWSDWKNWRKYHSTILYMIMFALLYEVLTYNYSLWIFKATLIPTHTLNSLLVTFITFPCLVLLFLSNFPEDVTTKKILHIIFWIILYSIVEYFYHAVGLFKYSHGWNFGCSILFNCIMFPMLLLHHKKPLLAYFLSIPIAIFYLIIFNVPISSMK